MILVLYSIDWLVQLWIWPCLKSLPLPASCNIIMQGFNQGSGWKIIDSDLFLVAKLSYVCSSNWRTLSKHYFYSVVGLGHNGWIAFPTWISIDLYCRYEHTFKTDIVNVESDPLLQETNLLDGANHMGFKMSKVKKIRLFWYLSNFHLEGPLQHSHLQHWGACKMRCQRHSTMTLYHLWCKIMFIWWNNQGKGNLLRHEPFLQVQW